MRRSQRSHYTGKPCKAFTYHHLIIHHLFEQNHVFTPPQTPSNPYYHTTIQSTALTTPFRLEKSRAQRILWLLTECNVDYELKLFKRGSNQLAGPELKEIHPLGKSPVISIDAAGLQKPLVVAESSLITEYLAEHFAKHLVPEQWQVGKEGQVVSIVSPFVVPLSALCCCHFWKTNV